MFSTLASNPEQASQMLANNPMFAGNPQLQQQVSAMMPQMLQQMQNPAIQQLMGNPEALAVSILSFNSIVHSFVKGCCVSLKVSLVPKFKVLNNYF